MNIYKLVGAYNSLNIFPAEVTLIFINQHSKEFFSQTIDENGIVTGFADVTRYASQIFFYEGDYISNWIGQNAYYGYAISTSNLFICDDKRKLSAHLANLIEANIFENNPIAGVEAARFVRDIKAECRYAELTVKRILPTSGAVARKWTEKALLSEQARLSARNAFNYHGSTINTGKKLVIFEQSFAFERLNYFTHKYDNLIITTNSLFRKMNYIGIVDIDVLFFDLYDITMIRGGVQNEYARIITRKVKPKIFLTVPNEKFVNRAHFVKNNVSIVYARDIGSVTMLVSEVAEQFVDKGMLKRR